MPYCPKCGTEVREDANFCRKCGYNLRLLGEISDVGRMSNPQTVNTKKQQLSTSKKEMNLGSLALKLFLVFIISYGGAGVVGALKGPLELGTLLLVIAAFSFLILIIVVALIIVKNADYFIIWI